MNIIKTKSQEQFYTLNKILDNDTAYNIVSAVKIDGDLNIERLKDAWESSLQIWDNHFEHKLEIHFFENENIVESIIKANVDMPFDLLNDSPIRAFLFSNRINRHYFVIIQHHAITDLHVKNLLSDKICNLYNELPSDTQFITLNENLDNSQYEKQEKFWSNYIQNGPQEPLVLPSESRRSFNGDGKTIFFNFGKSTTEELLSFSRNSTLDPFLILLTCYAVFLSKISGQSSFYIGVPFSNRRDNDRKRMIGPFVNILPLLVEINSDESLLTLYSQIRKQMLLLHRNQEFPFQNIARIYEGKRDLSIPYLLQAGFTREEPFNLDLHDLTCTPIQIRPNGAQMDLFMTYWIENDFIKIRLEYNTKAFENNQITIWFDSYKEIVNKFINSSDTKIYKISPLSQKIKSKFNNYYNQNKRNYDLDISFHNHLKKAYESYTDSIAIQDDNDYLTFQDFRIRVSSISSELHSKFGEGNTIAVSMNNSIERICLIHGIICSGNAYLPIDSTWPQARIKYILSNSESSVFITDGNSTEIQIDDISILREKNLGNKYIDFPQLTTHPKDPIAVLYTSGSTGNPKGVKIPGRGIVNRLQWMQEAYPINDNDTLIHKVPYTFDVSMWEIFWPFLNGARLFIPGPFDYLDNNKLGEMIKRERVTYVHFVPSLLKAFLKSNSHMLKLPDLKAIICSGEALTKDLTQEFFKSFPETPIHNLYGPTEASIDVTSWTCYPHINQPENIPIGYPIANTRIYILDKDLQICPPYVHGQIAITGENLSSGYINNEDESKKRFIIGDWGWGKETIYLTGDIGFYNKSLVIKYLGRDDQQVKINGIRIELDEIGTHVKRISKAEDVLVMMIESDITAYIKNTGIDSEYEIKKSLKMFLPGNMIPNIIHFLDDFPQLSNGKIDRNKLQSIKLSTKEYSNYNGDLGHHSELTSIWKEVLKLDIIDPDVNFFDLGGHSLLIPILKERIEQSYNVSIKLTDLFTYPTLNSQCSLLGLSKKKSEGVEIPLTDIIRKRRSSIKNRYKRTVK